MCEIKFLYVGVNNDEVGSCFVFQETVRNVSMFLL